VDRAYEARPETRENIKAKPSVYMRRFYYDTTVYNPDMIEFEHANFETLGTSGAAEVAVGGGAIPNVRFPPDSDRFADMPGGPLRAQNRKRALPPAGPIAKSRSLARDLCLVCSGAPVAVR
jgi:hypothetical protein